MFCLAAERFDAPLLLEGPNVLGLFNRRGRQLFLHESGRAAQDSVFIEHNGLLLTPGAASSTIAEGLAAVLGALPAGGRLVVSGVDTAHLAAARQVGAVRLRAVRPAPFVDLSAPAPAGGYLAMVSANTRQMLRRSFRRLGEPILRRAADPDEALDFLTALMELHQAHWQRRGQPGAFADPWVRRFHQTLVMRAMPRGEVDLLELARGGRVLGYLYNFRYRGQVLAYQAGFDNVAADTVRKPGLTAHHLAIERAAAEGMIAYDFLGGEARYKRSLSTAETMLHWFDLAPRRSLCAVLWRIAGQG